MFTSENLEVPGPGHPFTIYFENGRRATAVRVEHRAQLANSIALLGFHRSYPTLVLVGGAGGTSQAELAQLYPLFQDVLARMMEAHGVCVVDGGTDAGVMSLMGRARTEIKATFPLVGVAATGTVVLPGAPAATGHRALLDPYHTHFMLVPGTSWGDEVSWLAGVATTIAQEQPSVTVLVSGGKIAYQDVAASIHAGRAVIAIQGSGGTADALTHALVTAPPDRQTREVVESGLLRAVDSSDGPLALMTAIEEIFALKDEKRRDLASLAPPDFNL
jgi:hypothetical protein